MSQQRKDYWEVLITVFFYVRKQFFKKTFLGLVLETSRGVNGDAWFCTFEGICAFPDLQEAKEEAPGKLPWWCRPTRVLTLLVVIGECPVSLDISMARVKYARAWSHLEPLLKERMWSLAKKRKNAEFLGLYTWGKRKVRKLYVTAK